MQGPFHCENGESYAVDPGCFYNETYIWTSWANKSSWNGDYCFVDVTVENK